MHKIIITQNPPRLFLVTNFNLLTYCCIHVVEHQIILKV